MIEAHGFAIGASDGFEAVSAVFGALTQNRVKAKKAETVLFYAGRRGYDEN